MDASIQTKGSPRSRVVRFVVAAVLALAAAIALKSGWDYYQSRQPRMYGQNLEIRVLAVDSSGLLGDEKRTGEDIFSPAEAAKLGNDGETPTGWRWLPVDDSIDESDTLRKLAVHRNQDGHLFAMVADRPETSLVHGTNANHWGIKSAKVTEYTESGWRQVRVEVWLDEEGARLLRDLSGSHVRHYLAIVVAGRIIMAPQVYEPIGDRFDITLGAGVPDLPPGDTAQVDRDERDRKLTKLRSEAARLLHQLVP